MNKSIRNSLLHWFLIIAIIYLVFHGLAMAKTVLAPIFLSLLIAMVLAPVANFLEKKGVGTGWAAFLSDLIFIIFILGILVAVGAEIQKLANNFSSIQDRLSSIFSQVNSFFKQYGYSFSNPFKDTGGSALTAPTGTDSQGPYNLNDLKTTLSTALTWTFSSLTTLLIIVVYIFFMLLFRDKFEKATLRFVPKENRDEGKTVISEILEDAQQYLFGHVILISILTALYTVGFTIAGMKSAFVTALLASVLTLVPYVGTMIGNLLALGVAFITTGNMSAVWIVLATVTIGQFIESYFLEPYIVGKRMNVNPLFTIFSVTIGAAVWGIWGMIVFLPLFSFIKAIADHIPKLHALGYAIGKEDTVEESDSGLKKKIKSWF